MMSRKVFVPVGVLPAPTERDLAVGWPAHLCGGPLFVDNFQYALMSGVIVEVDPEVAAELGSFEEDALSEDDAWDAMTEEEPRLHWLWSGVYEARPRRQDNLVDGARSKPGQTTSTALLAQVRARQKGRPSRAIVHLSPNKTPYDDPVQLRFAVLSHCRDELTARCPFIDLAALEGIVAAACDRARLQSLSTRMRQPAAEITDARSL
jgi:hypothetical protein